MPKVSPKAFLKSGFFKSHAHAANYVEYINKQSPLFSGSGDISLPQALDKLDLCRKSTLWKHIFSLRGEDAARLAIDRDYMKQLVATQKDIWAKAHNISPENLVVLASFHAVDAHPHLHMVMFSTNPREGRLRSTSNKSLGELFRPMREKVKGSIANAIFKEDLHDIYVTKAGQKTALQQSLTMTLAELGKSTHPVAPEIQQAMETLATNLAAEPKAHGKYGYLPPALKEQINEVLRTVIAKDAAVGKLFGALRESQKALTQTYVASNLTLTKKMHAWEEAFFAPSKTNKGETYLHNRILETANHLSGVERYREEKSASALEERTAPVATQTDDDSASAQMIQQWEASSFSFVQEERPTPDEPGANGVDNLPSVEQYKEEKAASAQDAAPPSAPQVSSHTAPAPTSTAPPAQTPKSEALVTAEYEMKAAAERYLRGQISPELTESMLLLGGAQVTYERQPPEGKQRLHAMVQRLLSEVPEAGAPLVVIHQETAPHLSYSQFLEQYLHAQPFAPAQSAETTGADDAANNAADTAENPTPLHRLILEYAPHFHGGQTADLRTIQREKDMRALRLQLSQALDKSLCETLNGESAGKWAALAARLHAAKPVKLEDGTVLPKLYRTASKADQPQIVQLVRQCWTEECSRITEAMADKKNANMPLRDFQEALIAPPKGISAAVPNLAVRHLLQYATRPKGSEQELLYPDTKQALAATRTKASEEKPPNPTEAERLAAWRVRCAVEKSMQDHPALCAAPLLQLRAQINIESGAVPYYALPKTVQQEVDAFVSVLLEERAIQKELNTCYKNQTEHRQGVKAYAAALFEGDRAYGLRTLVLEYAAAATPQAPVALNVPQRREAARQIEREVDKIICAALNSSADGEPLLWALLETGDAVLPLSRQETGDAQAPGTEMQPEEPPEAEPEQTTPHAPALYYGMLEAEQKHVLNTQLSQLLQQRTVQQAIERLLALRSESTGVQQWVQNAVNPLKNSGARLQNLLLHHLELYRWEQANGQPPHERLTQDAKVYHDKTPLMALTNMLYAISASIHEDTRRLQNYAAPRRTHQKIRVKKIEKQPIDRNEPIQP